MNWEIVPATSSFSVDSSSASVQQVGQDALYNEYLLNKSADLNDQLAEKANARSMQNVEDYWSRSVEGMRKAGLNPGLMYSTGASSNAPTSSAASVNPGYTSVSGLSASKSRIEIIKAILGAFTSFISSASKASSGS